MIYVYIKMVNQAFSLNMACIYKETKALWTRLVQKRNRCRGHANYVSTRVPFGSWFIPRKNAGTYSLIESPASEVFALPYSQEQSTLEARAV